jgi:hypothetical protein
MTLTGWGVLLGLLVAAIVVAAIALIIRFVIRHRRGYGPYTDQSPEFFVGVC